MHHDIDDQLIDRLDDLDARRRDTTAGRSTSGGWLANLSGVLLGMLAGGLLMFFFDPRLGRGRRIDLAQRATSLGTDLAQVAEGKGEDIANRASGFAAEHDLAPDAQEQLGLGSSDGDL